MILRPLREEDMESAELLARDAVAALPPAQDDRQPPAGDPAPATRWRERFRHLLGTDPGGCWAATRDDGALSGFALSLRREGMWILSGFAVRPGAPGDGAARALLGRATDYGAGVLRGAIVTSGDPRAAAIYRIVGHRLHPTMRLAGTVSRDGLKAVRHVRESSDLGFADAVDWLVRGAPHGPDHALLAAEAELLVAETATGRGYAWSGPSGPLALSATDAVTGRELLGEVLARAPAGMHVTVPSLTAEQSWAVDVGIAAGLWVLPDGFLCLRGMRPPAPYVPSEGFA